MNPRNFGKLFHNLIDAAESEREWAFEHPEAKLSQKVRRSVRAVEDATGADLKPSVGRIFSMYVPVPVHRAHEIDAAIDAWGDKRKAEKKLKKKSGKRSVDPYNPF